MAWRASPCPASGAFLGAWEPEGIENLSMSFSNASASCCAVDMVANTTVRLTVTVTWSTWSLNLKMRSIQAAQTASLLEIFDLSTVKQPGVPAPINSRSPSPLPQGASPVWKVLVLDELSKDILATVLRVQDLRDVGVTLHLLDGLLFPSFCSLMTIVPDNCIMLDRNLRTCLLFIWCLLHWKTCER